MAGRHGLQTRRYITQECRGVMLLDSKLMAMARMAANDRASRREVLMYVCRDAGAKGQKTVEIKEKGLDRESHKQYYVNCAVRAFQPR